jgi:hypothetical protein
MTRDELRAIMPDITDEQLSAVLSKHHDEVNAKAKATEDKFSAYKDKADKYDKEQAAKLTEQEKLDKLIKEAEQKVLENSRLLNRTKVQAKFVEAGIKEESYSSLLDSIVSDDESKSLEFADNLIKAFSANAAAAAAAAKQEAMQTPPPAPGVVPPTDAAAAQQTYNKAVNGGSVLDIIQAVDGLRAAQTKIGG